MMKMKITSLGIIVLIFIFCSCSKNKQKNHYLQQSRQIVNLYPDSALSLLDSILEPAKMPEEQYMQYLVTRVQAKYKTYKDISGDTAIFRAKAYFEKQNKDPEQIALANLYTGCVCRMQKSLDKAQELYLEALRHSQKTDNIGLQGVIYNQMGNLYYMKNLHDSSTIRYKLALDNYLKIENQQKFQMDIIYSIALNFLITKEIDSALLYFQKGFEIADAIKDMDYQAKFLNSLGFLHNDLKEYDKSKTYLKRALRINKNPRRNPTIYTNLMNAYNLSGQKDSAHYYMQEAEDELLNTDDDYVHLHTYDNLSKIKTEEKDYKEALKYYQKYNYYFKEIQRKERSDDFIEIEKKYNMAEKEKKLVEAEKREQLYLFLCIAALLLFFVTLLAVKAHRHKHKQAVEKNKSLDKEIKNIIFLNNIYKYLNTGSTSFEREVESLSLNYSIKEKSKGYGIIHAMLKDMKKDTQARLSELTLGFLREQGFEDELLEILSTPDMLYLSLIRCGYDIKDIASVLGTTPHALQMRKQRLVGKVKKAQIDENKIQHFLP